MERYCARYSQAVTLLAVRLRHIAEGLMNEDLRSLMFLSVAVTQIRPF